MTKETSIDIYERLFYSLRIASETEKQLRQQHHEGFHHNDTALKQLDEIAGTELPGCMGKMISQLELHSAFQSLGRYVRSFADAEFVVRNLKQQILTSLDSHYDKAIIDVVNSFINCCISIHVSKEEAPLENS